MKPLFWKLPVVLSSLLGLALLGLFFAETRRQRLLREFLSEHPKPVVLRSLTFNGQQRSLLIKDPESLACVAASLRTQGAEFHGGVTYSAIFQLGDGRRIETYVVVNGRLLMVAGAHDETTSDPRYHLVALPETMPRKLANGLSFLTAKDPGAEPHLTIE